MIKALLPLLLCFAGCGDTEPDAPEDAPAPTVTEEEERPEEETPSDQPSPIQNNADGTFTVTAYLFSLGETGQEPGEYAIRVRLENSEEMWFEGYDTHSPASKSEAPGRDFGFYEWKLDSLSTHPLEITYTPEVVLSAAAVWLADEASPPHLSDITAPLKTLEGTLTSVDLSGDAPGGFALRTTDGTDNYIEGDYEMEEYLPLTGQSVKIACYVETKNIWQSSAFVD